MASFVNQFHNRLSLSIAIVAVAVAMPFGAAAAQGPIGPVQRMSASVLALRDSVVAIARSQIGRRYVFGGASPNRGFDCSGLVKFVLESLNVEVPRTASAQARFGSPVARDTTELRPGDLLLFGREEDGVSHVGIYVGNGRYIHASSIAGRVIESPLNRHPSSLVKVLMSARRVLALDDRMPIRSIGEASLLPAATVALIAARQKQ